MHEKTKDLLKMLGGAIVIAGGAVWALSSQIHSFRNELKNEIHSISSDLKDEIHSVGTDMHSMETRLNKKIAGIDKRVTVIETVLMNQRCPLNHIATVEAKSNE